MEFLKEYFNEATKIINKHNGIVDRLLGDGILAYFGYNKHDKSNLDPFDAIDAALELRKSFDTIKKNGSKYVLKILVIRIYQ